MEESRQERRRRRQIKKATRMPQHGKGLARIYKNAISRRARNTNAAAGAVRENSMPARLS